MQEKQKKWILRIALYLIGIMVLALGITLNTKTNLGVSPIISLMCVKIEALLQKEKRENSRRSSFCRLPQVT